MSNIEFQNGFLCGMATKGMTKGTKYQPIIWNDYGIYDYFYIDFKKGLENFSTGMLTESIVVHDSEELFPDNFEKISNGIYKIYCNIADKVNGIIVVNKPTSYLNFSDGRTVPTFAIFFYVAGIVSYTKLKYLYDSAELLPIIRTFTEKVTFAMVVNLEILLPTKETVILPVNTRLITESVSIALL